MNVFYTSIRTKPFFSESVQYHQSSDSQDMYILSQTQALIIRAFKMYITCEVFPLAVQVWFPLVAYLVLERQSVIYEVPEE